MTAMIERKAAKPSKNTDGLFIYDSVPVSYWRKPSKKEEWERLYYGEYLKTDRWAELRRDALKKNNGECSVCLNPATQVHHKRYPDIFGYESVFDLSILCKGCHYMYHNPYPGLDEVREEVMEGARSKDGIVCPVCNKFSKVYKRKLSSGMSRYLIAIVNNFDGNWVTVPNLDIYKSGVQRGDYAYLHHWDLIEEKPNEDSSKKNSGIWRPTERGIHFVHREIKVPTHVYLYNNTVQGFTEEQIGIVGALGEKFDYEELMSEEIKDK